MNEPQQSIFSVTTSPQHRPPRKSNFLLSVFNSVCDGLSAEGHMHAWPTIWSEPAMTMGDDWLIPPLKQPRVLINTSGPQHLVFKVISLKLSFRAWSNPSLPFTLLPDMFFLYRFIKLIPFSALLVGEVWMNYDSTQHKLNHAFQSCR